MTEPTSPKAWAIFLSTMWGPRFPVDVRTIALEYSRQRYSDPITEIEPAPVRGFEGALYFRPQKGCWYVLYNPASGVVGRVNFTIAHELGHYLVHRRRRNTFECSQENVLAAEGVGAKQLEQEANDFASYLLMPIDDFRVQVGDEDVTLDLLGHCADRYNVSLTAAALKWLEFTSKRAVLVVSRDDFVLWSRSSNPAFWSGVFFRQGTPVPDGSLVKRTECGANAAGPKRGVQLAAGVWVRHEPVTEMVILSDRYDFAISLLLFADQAPPMTEAEEEESDGDAVDDFARWQTRRKWN